MDTYKIAVSNMKLDRKLLPGDPAWHTFNGSFQNLDLEVSDLLDVVYYGRAITTQHKNHWRTAENYLCGQHIGLDFDHNVKSIQALAQDKFISKYAAFVHTTISHTPEAPRARVLFVLDAPIMQPSNYALAVSSLLWLFGTADRQCKDAARFFYGAPRCDFEYINQVLPLDAVKKMIDQYKQTGETERKQATRPDYLPPASQQEVAEALSRIPPWGIAYDEWVTILMALHSQFGEDGYILAERWADGKPGEVQHKWKSFKQTGNTTGAVTIASVFGIAKRFGWSKVV